MKKIDRLLLTSFIGPFSVSFGIALFVLIMQFLWLYIDEIAGKGVNIVVMTELLGYLSISTFPMALPIAVLISSVMVMGNLAERYELSSMKSAGVSLLRIMLPLMVVCSGVALFSYTCSNYLIPVSNLKFRTRLFDIRKQKPALSIEKGVFNEDFRQFVIRVGDKSRDGETIKEVLIEDQTSNGKVKFSQILADSGQMFTSEDKRYFVMNLFNGAQYQEPIGGGLQSQKYPFVRTNFKTWSKVWDMKEFEMNSTDEERFKTQRSMLSMRQLELSIDSLKKVMWNNRQALVDDMLANAKRQPVKPKPIVPTAPTPDTSLSKKKSGLAPQLTDAPKTAASSTSNKIKPKKVLKTPPPPPKPAAPRTPNSTLPSPFQNIPEVPKQQLDKPLKDYALFVETFPADRQQKILGEALRQHKITKSNIETRKAQVASRYLEGVKNGYELYTKYAFAIVCFLFLFIGAPMGALIRKGGFGYPILISIIFFVIFIFLTILCRKLAESYVLSPFWAAMMPCIVLIPLAATLTHRAINDIQLFSTERIEQAGRWIMRKIRKER